jgi:hypothetical protein
MKLRELLTAAARIPKYCLDVLSVDIRGLTFALCLLLLCRGSAQAQNATLSGSITDPKGAVLPKASVDLVNQDTGVILHAESNDSEFKPPAITRSTAACRAGRFRLSRAQEPTSFMGRSLNTSATRYLTRPTGSQTTRGCPKQQRFRTTLEA